MTKPFAGFAFRGFWNDSKYARERYIERAPTPTTVVAVEKALGYKLPTSYVWLMTQHNGGIPARSCFPAKKRTSWATDHVAVFGISSIGREKAHSLCGALGSEFMLDEWGYPRIGVVFADCPSAGHDVIMFDYRKCGPRGEPSVVHVDQEGDYAITPLAKNFETFVRGLVDESEFEDDEDEPAEAEYRKVLSGTFSPTLAKLLSKVDEFDAAAAIRDLAERIVDEKGHFSLHADPLSHFMYDVELWLYTTSHPVFTRETFLADYEKILCFDGDFSTAGYAPKFVTDWFDARIEDRTIVRTKKGLTLSAKAAARVVKKLKKLTNA
jgi:hypothetical protein